MRVCQHAEVLQLSQECRRWQPDIFCADGICAEIASSDCRPGRQRCWNQGSAWMAYAGRAMLLDIVEAVSFLLLLQGHLVQLPVELSLSSFKLATQFLLRRRARQQADAADVSRVSLIGICLIVGVQGGPWADSSPLPAQKLPIDRRLELPSQLDASPAPHLCPT